MIIGKELLRKVPRLKLYVLIMLVLISGLILFDRFALQTTSSDKNIRSRSRGQPTRPNVAKSTKGFSGPDSVFQRPQVALGQEHTCVLKKSGAVVCLGENRFGQLGQTDLSSSDAYVDVADLRGTIMIKAGRFHTCALTQKGDIYCWGWMAARSVFFESSTPKRMDLPERASFLDTGDDHTCAVTTSGKAYCWGAGQHGQLGNGDRKDRIKPTQVVDLEEAVQIHLGPFHSCAVLKDRTAQCWGRNDSGQLGDGRTRRATKPVVVLHTKHLNSLALTSRSTCGLQTNGSVYCWGERQFGLLGGNVRYRSQKPTHVNMIEKVRKISAGTLHVCALLNNHLVKCWGANTNDQLGINNLYVSRGPNPTNGYFTRPLLATKFVELLADYPSHQREIWALDANQGRTVGLTPIQTYSTGTTGPAHYPSRLIIKSERTIETKGMGAYWKIQENIPASLEKSAKRIDEKTLELSCMDERTKTYRNEKPEGWSNYGAIYKITDASPSGRLVNISNTGYEYWCNIIFDRKLCQELPSKGMLKMNEHNTSFFATVQSDGSPEINWGCENEVMAWSCKTPNKACHPIVRFPKTITGWDADWIDHNTVSFGVFDPNKSIEHKESGGYKATEIECTCNLTSCECS